MIVDDRPLFIQYLKTNIEWEKYGFTICNEAKNGLEALEKAKSNPPDILLTDINMPLMDGLVLAEKLLEEYPDLDVVLITGYSEFEYARKAIKLGVCNYIVKPFEKEELLLTLLKLKDNINKVCESEIENENKEKTLLELLLQQLIYREEFHNQLEIENNFNRLGFSLNSKFFTTFVIELYKKEVINTDNHIWKNTIINLIQQMFESNTNIFVFSDYEGRIIILYEKSSEKEDSLLKHDLNKLVKLLKKHLEFDLTIGVGGCYYGFNGIRKSYLEGISAIRANYEIGINKIIYYDEIVLQGKDYVFYSAETNEIILKHLRNGSIEEIKQVLGVFYQSLKNTKGVNEFTDIIYKGFMSLLFSYIYQTGLEINDLFGDKDYVVKKLQEKDLTNQFNLLIDFYSITINFTKSFQNTRSYTLAKGAMKYIEKNYNRSDLSVKDVSTSQLINETYMRTIFKKETEMTVNEYITKVRLEKTKELLKNTEYRLSDIAEMVGYNDSSYLSKIFKKLVGMSPSRYRTTFDNSRKL